LEGLVGEAEGLRGATEGLVGVAPGRWVAQPKFWRVAPRRGDLAEAEPDDTFVNGHGILEPHAAGQHRYVRDRAGGPARALAAHAPLTGP
jgi:hypothetical protein